MRVSLVRSREVNEGLTGAWERLRQGNLDLVSPYFHPEFTQIIASSRDDVEIAVLESGSGVIGLFPF
jgi:hypothetical protein